MILLRHLFKNYTTREGTITALEDVSLHVHAGEIYGIIGKSGAGKSTLLRSVNLLEKPDQGEVWVAGQDLLALSPNMLQIHRRKIGMIFQHFNLLNSRTVFDNVAFPLKLAKSPSKNIQQKVMRLLQLTGLENKKNLYPAQLSGGQKQRVAIARALASDPSVLLCDEATSALDPETTHSILHLLKNIRDELNLTILLITHEMSVIKAICDRVAVLDQGHLIEENDIDDFFAHPKTMISKQFIINSIAQQLPDVISDHILINPEPETYPLIRLWFFKNTATQPIISELIHRFHLRVNILQANVEYIKKQAMGIMLIAVKGEEKQLSDALHYLENTGVQKEVIGHVTPDVISFD